jgi:acyl transferase domain-containing protein/NADPH:quinone reductase-like Zn-dependent oxidoreductase/acyl carrier protein
MGPLADIHYLRDEIAIVGWSCRLPGANSIDALWSLLIEGRGAVTQVPPDRFSLQRFGHPRRRERGKSYTWAAGILDDVWGFDPSVFGISPREAEQMDPQQRILLQLTWEALEDAGIRPSSIAGTETGVFVGASQTDYAHAVFGDQAIADSHFATGNALAIIANRISYIYDLHGPSVTFDTACSSSLVALHHAAEALRSGRIDTAIVGGINIIGSPAEFVSFSQASMLSPTGLCRAFSADADGYVRAEGGAVLVLRRGADAGASPVHGTVQASDVNSDGRTGGISLPSGERQEALLSRVYSRAGIDPAQLAFVEAHGTGTPVGDPIEAQALGASLGRGRAQPLPIGSIKSNIGHVEAASGLAGLLKALLALNHGILPRSLHISAPNPKIDFDGLNLALCEQPILLTNARRDRAGVNSFGFGGTNAHVVVGRGKKPTTRQSTSKADFLSLSAANAPALKALAQKYVERLAHCSDAETAVVANAAACRRDLLAARLVVSTTRRDDVDAALRAFIADNDHPRLEAGAAAGDALPVAFIYSGNGSQWPGMGVAAYRTNASFRAHFDRVDAHFGRLAGWSLKEALFSADLGARLPQTAVAQPLIFAIQSAVTASLRARGLRPAAVLGHSVGEIAAAEAAGILDLATAIEVIHFRSKHQELVRHRGRMAVLLASAEDVGELIDRIGDVEIAAFNSPRAITVAGADYALLLLKTMAKKRGIAHLDLDLDYPFHSAFMTPVRAPLLEDLKHIVASDGGVPFVSTVTGSCVPGLRLNADYWWRNVREPVQFAAGIRATFDLGARFFIEIGPRSTLLKHAADSLTDDGVAGLSVLDRNDPDRDPIDHAVAKALIGGANLDTAAIFGPDSGAAVSLPSYPWQQEAFRYSPSAEAIGIVEPERHPFSGSRYSRDGLEWFSHIDTALFPELADHKVGDQVVFPGAGFLEIAFAVARECRQSECVAIADFDILKPLDLSSGETREVMTRFSPTSSTIEIFSRPRLSQASWLLHCRGRILESQTRAVVPVAPPNADTYAIDGARIYKMGEACGLRYGPAFRLLETAEVYDDRLIDTRLAPARVNSEFVLDPIRVDTCGHGILATYGGLRADERGVAYLPVRVEEAALFIPGGAPERAVIEVVSRNERSIVANYYFLDAGGALLAVLRGLRCQAVQLRRSAALEANAFVEWPERYDGSIVGTTGIGVSPEAFVAAVRKQGLLREEARQSDENELIEGWATAAAYELVSALAVRSTVDIEALIAANRLPSDLRPWLATLLKYLEGAGLAVAQNGVWSIAADPLLPRSALVIKELAQRHPHRAAELLLAGAVTGFVEEAVRRGSIASSPKARISRAVLDFFELTSVELRQTSLIAERMIGNRAIWPEDRALRVLQIGFAPLTQSLLTLIQRRDATLTVFEPDRWRRELAERALVGGEKVIVADAESALTCGPFDLVVAVASLQRLPAASDLTWVHNAMAPRGLLLALEPAPSLFREFVFGLDADWFGGGDGRRTAGQLRRADDWSSALRQAGFESVCSKTLGHAFGTVSLLVAEPSSRAPAAATVTLPQSLQPPNAIQISDDSRSGLGQILEEMFRRRALTVTLAPKPDFSDVVPDVLIHIATDDEAPADTVGSLTARCLEIKAAVERFGSSRGKFWLVLRGALPNDGSPVRPVAAGIWAFSRTLANEFPHIDVRRVDIASDVPLVVAAARLGDIVSADSAETELQIDRSGIRAVRVDVIKRVSDRLRNSVAAPEAARLQRRLAVGQRVAWEASTRSAPGNNEVEIVVEATGLNFRDVMWSLSLLPDDIIEGGVAGATLGCECAGYVVRCGADVRELQPGDRVIAFAASAFATHVTVPTAQVAKLPALISSEAGATIPVAFLTAYYSLVTQAKLKRGEWVLIHGGAGGVGQAAIQIAQARGARIVATAGSRAKRDLLTAMGVHHVLDSRSTTLVDDVRAVAPAGVDVVLNSLAGDAMERSLACLRPFGRFVELGKRDYAANTLLGLRPFRNNLSYFGVDLDQILLGRKRVGRKIFADLMQLFASGVLTPLPYSVFRACDLNQAFQLMQRADHVGKIVVQPPDLESLRQPTAPFRVDPDGTHLITGGFGGFGLEAAKWLVDRGARHLVLIGRRGASSEEAKVALADFAAHGIDVHAAACDVADRGAMERLFQHVGSAMPPIVGVLHAAMVLDDGLLSNLDEDRFRRVLEPKVRGADHLDQLTRAMALDYFVLFSSATTLVGNPGQANYVAANAYMEGLARRRLQEGLKALAIGWGPITDVGVLAQSEHLRSRFNKLTGVRGMRAREALDLMAQALSQPAALELAVMTISPTEGLFPADRLPVLSSPTFASLVAKGPADAGVVGGMDLRAIAAAEGVDAMRRKLTDVIVSVLACVLRTRGEDISRVRPLADIGLDSLMALEFAMNLEDSFGVHVSLTSAVGALTVASLATEIIGQLNLQETSASTMVRTIAEHHLSAVEPDQLALLQEIASGDGSTREIAKRGKKLGIRP